MVFDAPLGLPTSNRPYAIKGGPSTNIEFRTWKRKCAIQVCVGGVSTDLPTWPLACRRERMVQGNGGFFLDAQKAVAGWILQLERGVGALFIRKYAFFRWDLG